MRFSLVVCVLASHGLAAVGGFVAWPTVNARPTHPSAEQARELSRFVGAMDKAHKRCATSSNPHCARYR
jgi:hypothetical protein